MAYPLEVCGLMAGLDGLVVSIYPIQNRRASSYAYEMEPSQLIEALLDIEANGRELVAIYHSHPYGPAAPSATDIAQAHYPEAAQVIVSLEQPRKPGVGVFSIVDNVVETLPWQLV